ncbi:MAG: 4-hydroxy-tetrahydrodipicolinate synthase [Eubacteriales bacterium]|nr:4-hydroxy-tetrahydrodipicolinate synthase [Eubacteriales bacterium]
MATKYFIAKNFTKNIYKNMEPIFTGVATALVTPFNTKQQVDFPALRRLIKRQVKMHVDALVVLGTTGEISTLTTKERHAIIDCALQTTQGQIPLIFGIGGNDPASIIALGQYVVKASRNYVGKIGIMVTAPYYNKGTPDGIYAYYQTITNAVKLPTIVYNIPSRTGVNITPENMARIAHLPYVAGVKEASGNLAQIGEVVRLCPHTAVYSGDDTLALPCYAVGCRGIISVASNIDVVPVQQIWQLYCAGKPFIALQAFQKAIPFYQSLFRVVNPIPIKAELAQLGLIKNVLRLPLLPIQ